MNLKNLNLDSLLIKNGSNFTLLEFLRCHQFDVMGMGLLEKEANNRNELIFVVNAWQES